MSLLKLQYSMETDIMTIPGIFIDYYLPAASGEDVRIYLYLLRILTGGSQDFTIPQLAERLDITEQELLRSLSYWEETGLVRLSYDSDGKPESVLFLDIVRAAKEELALNEPSPSPAAPEEQKRMEAERRLEGGSSHGENNPAVSFPLKSSGETASRNPASAGREKTPVFAAAPGADPSERELTEASFEPDFLAASFMLQSLIGREITPAETRQFCLWYLRLGRSQATMEQLLMECRNKSGDHDPTFEDIDRTAAAWFRLSGASGMPKSPEPEPEALTPPVPRTPTRQEMNALDTDSEFQALALMTENCLSRPLSGADTELLGYWYINFDRSVEVLDSLIDYCITACSPRKPNMKYMDSVAISWFSEGIRSASQAREYSRLHNKTVNTVLKAMGYGPRNPRDVTESEEQLIREWSRDLNMPLDLIRTACERATSQTNGNRFHYANSILRDWSRKGFRTLEDVKKEDEEHFEKTRNRPQVKVSQSAQNSHNFPERDTDYEARILERIRNNEPT